MRAAPLLALVPLAGCTGLFQPPAETTPPVVVDPCTEPLTWYYDDDGDGFGTAAETWESCTRPSYLWSDNDRDCDDADAGTFPGAIESCDGVDRDCNGIIDDAGEFARRWYPDEDEDGYPDLSADPRFSCERPGGFVAPREGDCDDADPTVHPHADDPPCDGIDQSCLGNVEREVARTRDQIFHDVGAALQISGGEPVLVCPGLHDVGPVHAPAGLDVRGMGQVPDDVVLRATTGRMLDVVGPVSLDNLTLEGGDALSDETDPGAGGALRADGERVVLHAVVLRNHHAAGDGGALHLTTGSLTLDDVHVEHTTAAGSGGAVWARVAGPILFTDVSVQHTIAGEHGGAFALRSEGATGPDIQRLTTEHTRAGGDGGAVYVRVAGAQTRLFDSVLVDGVAGGVGGLLDLRADGEHVLQLQGTHLRVGRAHDGGILHATAGGNLSLSNRSTELVDGVATDRGGLVLLVSQGDMLDVDTSGSSYRQGSATTGGLFHVQSEDQADFYCNGSGFSHGFASRGAGLYFTGTLAHDTEVDLDRCPLSDTSGAPALQVEGEVEGTMLVELVAPETHLVRNRDGGMSAPPAVTLRLRGAFVGTGSDENGGFDLRSGDTTWDGSGSATVSCLFSSCSE